MAQLKSGSTIVTLFATSPSEGFVSGGNWSPTPFTAISSFPFTTSPITSVDVGEISQARQLTVGQQSALEGFTSGGWTTVALNTVDKFPFTTPFTTATDVGDLSVARGYVAGGHSSSTEGFTSGGFSPGPTYHDVIDKFPFSSSSFTATDHGELTAGISDGAGQSSSTDGFLSGGSLPAYSDVVQKFPFSSAPVTATDVGEILTARIAIAGHSSTTDGFISGGYGGTPVTSSDVIEKFPFSSSPFTATDHGELGIAVRDGTGLSSSTDGFTAGAFAASNRVDKFPFSSPSTTTDVGELASGTDAAAGQSSNASVPYAALEEPILSVAPASIDITSFEGYSPTDAYKYIRYGYGDTFVFTNTVPETVPKTTVGFGTSYGYLSGGQDSSRTPTQDKDWIERFPFTAPFTTATDIGELSLSKTNPAGHSSLTDGYNAGGANGYPSVTMNQIDKFPFSGPPITGTDVGELALARYATSSAMSTTTGYMFAPSPTPLPVTFEAQKFAFGSPPVTSADIGEISSTIQGSAYTHSSVLSAFLSGGGDANQPLSFEGLTAITEFSFSSEISKGEVGELNTIRVNGGGGHSSDTEGFSSGGAQPFVPVAWESVDKFPFSGSFVTATDAGELSTGYSQGTHISSDTNGYIVDGNATLPENWTGDIITYPFTAPFTTSTDVGEVAPNPVPGVYYYRAGHHN